MRFVMQLLHFLAKNAALRSSFLLSCSRRRARLAVWERMKKRQGKVCVFINHSERHAAFDVNNFPSLCLLRATFSRNKYDLEERRDEFTCLPLPAFAFFSSGENFMTRLLFIQKFTTA
jgi:hypothetical protein